VGNINGYVKGELKDRNTEIGRIKKKNKRKGNTEYE
jgi:hypothetical protein